MAEEIKFMHGYDNNNLNEDKKDLELWFPKNIITKDNGHRHVLTDAILNEFHSA
jgi:hypothetical protein